ncbi:putative disease resistance RPP13-like protein 1 [Arachis stenosperma]|uniref:putative disease resistance RPP13-like protein 1 n=1 Tax=Arachis stenosperma TaxID=217475 RepID=UPI0025AB9728|nr:putative disease resistance RPP13-like protein 1 [Arachis stenosperma]
MMRGKKVDQRLLQRLENILNVVEAVLNDAEKKQITDPAVKRWLENLQDAVYDADDLLDEVATKAATQKDPGNFLSRFLNLPDREMVTRIEEIIARLEDIAKHKDILRLKKIAAKNMSGRIPSTSLVKKSDIFVGRDKEPDIIVKLLLDDVNNGELSVIPIVGMGGIGKTTLVKLIYNDDMVQQKFDVKAWVCVGEEVFDVLKVTKAVIEKTCSPCYSNDLDTTQNHLKNVLAGKKFLVVLDDVWSSNREGWESFLTPFECGSEGGKILVTTRLDTVASMVKTKHNETHNLSLLDEEQCWSVFANRAREPAESRDRSTLEEIGRKIVKKCKGLPLAAQTLGGLLRGKDNEKDWNDVLNSEFWELSEDYFHLPSYLKRCFVYCSLYPKDFEFDRNELTLLWMAKGLLLQPKSRNSLEETGYKYFDDLVSRSFFQHSKTYVNSFVMHDLMHDLATFYGGKFFSSILELKNAAKHDTKTRHLSCTHNNDDDSLMKITEACERLKHARTLLQINLDKYGGFSTGVTVPCDLLEQLKRLRVLSFNLFSDDENLMHGTIGELIHLRYLDLSDTSIVTLPESLSCLYNLQTLKLRNCRKLKKLPSKMQNLVNLHHLDVFLTDLDEMPRKMSKLKDLQFLSCYIAGKHEENGIGELGELTHLHGSLRIEKLENVKNSGEASNARMDEKIHLNALYLSWSSYEESEICDSQSEKDVLDKLRPHKDLKKLVIRRYRGTMFPDWVGQSSYHNVTELQLIGCRNCWVLPSLGQLPALMRLEISHCDMVTKIDGEFYKADATDHHQEIPFRSLQYLEFYRMGCWEEWESFACDDDDAPFPQLEKLVIKYCPKLRGDLPTFLPSLKTLQIKGCVELGCYLPGAPIIRELRIFGKQEARMRDLPLSLQQLTMEGKQLVESLFEAMTHTQPNLLVLKTSRSENLTSLEVSQSHSLQELTISECPKLDYIVRLPASLRELSIYRCPLLGRHKGEGPPHLAIHFPHPHNIC